MLLASVLLVVSISPQATAQPNTVSPKLPDPMTLVASVVPQAPTPDYNRDVLIPLHQAQAEEAAAAAAALAAQQAEAARQAELAREAYIASLSYGNNYTPGNCTWWVAQHVSVPSGMGNATNWEAGLVNAGWSYGVQIGAVGVSHAGYQGHVVYVIGEDARGVLISEMNYYGLYQTDTRYAAPGEFVYLHK